MLKIQEIREIIKLIDQSSIEKFSYESEGAKIVLKKGNGQQAAVTQQLQNSTYLFNRNLQLCKPTVVE